MCQGSVSKESIMKWPAAKEALNYVLRQFYFVRILDATFRTKLLPLRRKTIAKNIFDLATHTCLAYYLGWYGQSF